MRLKVRWRGPQEPVLAPVLAAVLAVSALAGCSVVPPFEKPVMAVPDHWMAVAPGASAASDGAHSSTGPMGAPVAAAAGMTAASAASAATAGRDIDGDARRFWTEFGSPQLQSLLAAGSKDGLDVAIARAKLDQARGAASIAAAAGMPTLSLGVDGSRGNTSAKKSTSATLQAGLTIDPWGGLDAQAQSARLAARAAGFDVVTVQRTVLAQIATQYFTLLACDERLRLAGQVADDAAELLTLIQRQADLGAASALEVAQQRNAVQTLQAALPALRQQRLAAQTQLAILVGVPPASLSLQPETLAALRVPEVAAVAPADVIDARPEVLSAEARLRAANFDVGAARAAFLPTLSLTASAGWLLNPTSALWSVAASALQPLIDGGQRQGQLRVDRAHAQELLASYRLAILQALQETETQLGAVDQLRQREALEDAAVLSATEALRLSRFRYEHGAVDLLAVLSAQSSLAQAQDTQAQVRLQRLQAAAALYIATGGRGELAHQSVAEGPDDTNEMLRITP